MRLSTVLPAAAGLVAGYVLSAAAGRGRYHQIRAAIDSATTTINAAVHHPRVEQLLFDLADRASSKSTRMPSPAADLIDTAAIHLQDTLTQPDHEPDSERDLAVAPAEAAVSDGDRSPS